MLGNNDAIVTIRQEGRGGETFYEGKLALTPVAARSPRCFCTRAELPDPGLRSRKSPERTRPRRFPGSSTTWREWCAT